MDVKEWAAEYRRINELEEQERREWLSRITDEEMWRIYQELCRIAASTNRPDDPVLWDMRAQYYADWEAKIRRIAAYQGYDLRI